MISSGHSITCSIFLHVLPFNQNVSVWEREFGVIFFLYWLFWYFTHGSIWQKRLNEVDYSKWDKHPIKSLHAEFCRNILRVQRRSPTNACQAELGRCPLPSMAAKGGMHLCLLWLWWGWDRDTLSISLW